MRSASYRACFLRRRFCSIRRYLASLVSCCGEKDERLVREEGFWGRVGGESSLAARTFDYEMRRFF